MSSQRPPLDIKISIEDFRAYYWLKEELMDFCRANGLSAQGSKIEIVDRIAHYLATGAIIATAKQPKKARNNDSTPLALDALIRANYRSDEEHRAFFKQVIGEHFKFTSAFMRYCKENVGIKTYADAVEQWLEEQKLKRDPDYQTEIAPQFEYNRFMRAYFAANPGKTRQDAIAAWKEVRAKAGSHEYKP